MMEYHCSKDTVVATKVFELALKTFPENETLVVRYLDFLISINDESSEWKGIDQRERFPLLSQSRFLLDLTDLLLFYFSFSTSFQMLELSSREPFRLFQKRRLDRSGIDGPNSFTTSEMELPFSASKLNWLKPIQKVSQVPELFSLSNSLRDLTLYFLSFPVLFSPPFQTLPFVV